jgi:S-adenosylmethionine:tRNA ribosyltransferase-isomerase
MRTDEFDFPLPPELIAQHPAERRDASRLLVVHRDRGTWEHRTFADLPEFLRAGDVLVRNDSKVVPARLVGNRTKTGGAWEGLFLQARADGTWEILAKTRGRPEMGERIAVAGGLELELTGRAEGGAWVVRPLLEGSPPELLERFGQVPLPPYIRKGREGPGDRERYQTVYARTPGSVAAPTAGLHFTEGVFDRLRGRGVSWVDVTLHVGIGTFRPIEAETIEAHQLHSEWATLTPDVADALNAAKAAGGRVVAVGTTATRTLETASQTGRFEPFAGPTGLYLKPGHAFRGVDALVTNFHLPRSSLVVLVSALAGVDLVRAAYAEAVRERYRFYSYGDAMLIL